MELKTNTEASNGMSKPRYYSVRLTAPENEVAYMDSHRTDVCPEAGAGDLEVSPVTELNRLFDAMKEWVEADEALAEAEAQLARVRERSTHNVAIYKAEKAVRAAALLSEAKLQAIRDIVEEGK